MASAFGNVKVKLEKLDDEEEDGTISDVKVNLCFGNVKVKTEVKTEEGEEDTANDVKPNFTFMDNEEKTSLEEYRNFQSLYEVKALPYIPIPFEEIDAYTKLPDYTEDRIKNINTVGVLKPISFSKMILYSTCETEKAKIKLDIKNLYNGPNFQGPGSDAKNFDMRAARVFGILETRGKEIVIRVHHFSPVQNVERCERILRLMAQVARQRISAYRYNLRKNPEIRHLMDEMKNEKRKRK